MNAMRRWHHCLPVLLSVVLLAACAGSGVRGQAPFVQINGLRLIGEELTLDLGVRNVTPVLLMIEHIEFSISLDQVSLAVYNAPSRASVIANGTENLRFRLVPGSEAAAKLTGLERGERSDLAYTLEGVLQVNEGEQLKIRRMGFLYPVPGRPGNFR